jgi:hypothetical protein
MSSKGFDQAARRAAGKMTPASDTIRYIYSASQVVFDRTVSFLAHQLGYSPQMSAKGRGRMFNAEELQLMNRLVAALEMIAGALDPAQPREETTSRRLRST